MADKVYDLIIIGGGISGLGVAWQAAEQKKSVLLLDKGQLAAATSDNSLRIIHGGLRYLQTMNIRRVMDSAREQADLLEFAPDLIKPLWCVMPLKKFGLKSKIPMWCGLVFYSILRILAGAKYCKTGYIVSKEWIDKNIPIIADEANYGAFVWRDAIMPSDRKFSHYVANTAANLGAEILEFANVKSFKKLPNNNFEVMIEYDGKTYNVETKNLVNTSGAWFQNLEQKSLFSKIKWCKAFNIVISKKVLNEFSVGVCGDLGRVFFLAPRVDNENDKAGTAIGTFYYMFDGNPDNAKVSDEEINESLTMVNKAFPKLQAKKEDIIKIELGILPACGEDNKGPVLYGSEKIRAKDNYIEVLSTKFTTFRSQARHVLKKCKF